MQRPSRRDVLATIGATAAAGCYGVDSNERLHVAPVEASTLGDGAVRPLHALPDELRGAVWRTLTTSPDGGAVRLRDGIEGLTVEGGRAVVTVDHVVTRGEEYHLDGLYADLVHDYPVSALQLQPVAAGTAEGNATADATALDDERAEKVFRAAAEAGTYRTVALPDRVEAVATEYDYVTVGRGADTPTGDGSSTPTGDDHYEVTLTRTEGAGADGLSARIVVPSDGGDVPMYDAADLPGHVREAFEEARETDEPARVSGEVAGTRHDGAIARHDGGYFRLLAEVVA